jgi:hypothetical protein
VIADVPFFPSLAAVIVAAPAARPVTSPEPPTLATVALLVDHVTERPVSNMPLESFTIAASWNDCPIAALAAIGLTVTDATRGEAIAAYRKRAAVTMTASHLRKPRACAHTRYSPEDAGAV